MAQQTIDYTTWRKGTRTRGSVRIGICPKCGRKGEINPAGHWTDGAGKPTRIIHVYRVLDPIPGSPFQFTETVDMCILDDKPAPIGAAARAAERRRQQH